MPRSYSLGLGAAAACLATTSAFAPRHATVHRVLGGISSTSFASAPAFVSPKSYVLLAKNELLSEVQSLHTAERLSGMS